MTRCVRAACPTTRREAATCEKDIAEIKSDVPLLKGITGTTLAGVLALVIRTFTS